MQESSTPEPATTATAALSSSTSSPVPEAAPSSSTQMASSAAPSHAIVESLHAQLAAAKEAARRSELELKKARTKISMLTDAAKAEEDLGEKLFETSTKLVEESQRSVKIQGQMESLKSK